MKYQIEIKRSVLKALRRLDKRTVEKIKNALGYKKLIDEEQLYRIRVGNYRIIYEIHDRVLLIVVLRLARRREDTY